MTRLLEKRVNRRYSLTRSARCYTARGRVIEGTMTDLSRSGCCIFSPRPPLRDGDLISVRIDGMEGFAGRVRWVRGPMMGVRFESDLYEPIVRHLAA